MPQEAYNHTEQPTGRGELFTQHVEGIVPGENESSQKAK